MNAFLLSPRLACITLVLCLLVWAGCSSNTSPQTPAEPPAVKLAPKTQVVEPAKPKDKAPSGLREVTGSKPITPKRGTPLNPETARQDKRTPADFAKDWVEVKKTRDEGERFRKAGAMAKSWKGGAFTWTGNALASLCTEATRTCSINVFEKNSTPGHMALGGFFPRVTFTPKGWGELKSQCAKKSECVITFHGALAVVQTDLDLPLALSFQNAAFRSARDSKPDENWFVRPKFKPRKNSGKKLRTGKPSNVSDLVRKMNRKTF